MRSRWPIHFKNTMYCDSSNMWGFLIWTQSFCLSHPDAADFRAEDGSLRWQRFRARFRQLHSLRHLPHTDTDTETQRQTQIHTQTQTQRHTHTQTNKHGQTYRMSIIKCSLVFKTILLLFYINLCEFFFCKTHKVHFNLNSDPHFKQKNLRTGAVKLYNETTQSTT